MEGRLKQIRARPNADAGADLADELHRAGRHGEALEVVQSALAQSPDDARLLLLHGRLLLATGQLEQAQMVLIQASRAAPASPDPLIVLGDVLLKRGDPTRALRVLEKASSIHPTNKELGTLLQRARRLSQLAAGDFDKSVMAPMPVEDVERNYDDEHTAPAQALPDLDEDPTTMKSVADVHAIPRKVEIKTLSSSSAPPGRHVPEVSGERPIAFTASHDSLESPAFDSGWDDDQETTTVGQVGDIEEEPTKGAAREPTPELSRSLRGKEPPQKQPVRARDAVPTKEPAKVPSQRPSARGVDRAAEQATREQVPRASAGSLAEHLEPDSDHHRLPESRVADSADGDDVGRPLEPDLEIGAEAGAPENIDRNLAALEELGIFEPPHARKPDLDLRGKPDRVGNRIGRTVIAVWAVGLVAAGAGFGGWRFWVHQRHEEASHLVDVSRQASIIGEHRGLVDAERHLLHARELDPRNSDVDSVLLFVHAQRSFEDGAFDPGFLRRTLHRATAAHADPAYISAAEAVLSAAENDVATAQRKMLSASRAAPRDANIAYLAGRLRQRMGDPGGIEDIERAHSLDPHLVPATLALVEARVYEGNSTEVASLLDSVTATTPQHLRARLERIFYGALDGDADTGLRALDNLAPVMEHGAPVDKMLEQLARARLLRRKDDAAGAVRALEAAYRIPLGEPRILAMLAEEALALGKRDIAKQAAARAVASSPQSAEYRRLLAGILIGLRDGVSALAALHGAPEDDPGFLALRVRAAILTGQRPVLDEAAPMLDHYLESAEDAPAEMRALSIRAAFHRGQQTEALERARVLAGESPDDATAQLALAESALAANDSATALSAVQAAERLAPQEPEVSYQLGRARRAIGDLAGAEQAFRAAITRLPEYADAQASLGSILLERAQYAEADTIFERLTTRRGQADGLSATLVGRLGRVEALLGLNRVADATVQFDSLQQEGDLESPRAQLTHAHLLLATHKAAEAVALLAPIVEDAATPLATVMMYADALRASGQSEAAVAAYDRAIGQASSDPDALIGRALASIDAGDANDAGEFVQRARIAISERPVTPATRAMLLVAAGRAELDRRGGEARDAQDSLLRATQLEGAPADAHFFLGEALRATRSPAARASYQRYLELDPEGRYADRARRATR